MNCPRCHKELALEDPTYGILPGENCQRDDEVRPNVDLPEFVNQSKADRIGEQRDKFDGDMMQPWAEGKDQKPNPDFIKAYPDRAKDYFSDEELNKL